MPAGEAPMSRLGTDRFVLAASDNTAAEALAAAHQLPVIVVDAHGAPQAVLDPATLQAADPDCRLLSLPAALNGVIVVAADVSLKHAAASWAVENADRHSAVVFARDGEIVGLLTGHDLAITLARARWRVHQDMHLPGDSAIPYLVRPCRFKAHEVRCSAVLTFTEYPEQPLVCPNPDDLADHAFVW